MKEEKERRKTSGEKKISEREYENRGCRITCKREKKGGGGGGGGEEEEEEEERRSVFGARCSCIHSADALLSAPIYLNALCLKCSR